MQLAHITPISLLDTIPVEQHTHLVLSELVRSNSRYSAFYRERAQNGDRIILDNPVHEDRPTKIEDWLDTIELIRPSVAVIPDVIDSQLMTLDNAREAVSKFRQRGFEKLGTELMAVPHADTQLGWLTCASDLARLGTISWFGISLERRLNDDGLALQRRRERVVMLSSFRERFAHIKLHLLGVSESGMELSDDRVWQRAESADTSKFAVWNMLETPVVPPVPTTYSYPGRTPFGGSFDYFFAGHPPRVSRRKMRNNLRTWNQYATRELD